MGSRQWQHDLPVAGRAHPRVRVGRPTAGGGVRCSWGAGGAEVANVDVHALGQPPALDGDSSTLATEVAVVVSAVFTTPKVDPVTDPAQLNMLGLFNLRP